MSTLKVNTIQDTTGNDALTIDSSGNVTASQGFIPSTQLSHRNLIINGAMQIDQRNAGSSVTPSSSSYTLDRWYLSTSSGSKFSIEQSSTAPAGFRNSAKITVASTFTPSAGSYMTFGYRVEGYDFAHLMFGTSDAKTFTMSFWVRSSLTGTFSGAFQSQASSRAYPFTFTISSADTFEYKTVTVAGDTTGSWNTTTLRGLELVLNLGSGSDRLGTAGSWSSNWYTGATGSVTLSETSGATFYLTGVQLEVGSVATPFEHRSYGEELAKCQRYYWKASESGVTTALGSGIFYSTTQGRATIQFPVEMRTNPTLSVGSHSNLRWQTAGSAKTPSATSSIGISRNLCFVSGTVSGATAGQATIFYSTTSDGNVTFDAEL